MVFDNLKNKLEIGMVGNTYLWKNQNGASDTKTTVDRIEIRDNGDIVVISTDNTGKLVPNDLSRFLEAIAIQDRT